MNSEGVRPREGQSSWRLVPQRPSWATRSGRARGAPSAIRQDVTVAVVDFQRRRIARYPSEVIDVLVDGRPLADVVGEVEFPFAEREGKPDLAGSYQGLGPEQVDGSPRTHFMGSDESHLFSGPRDKTILLGCECGEPGCWPLMARIEVTDRTVEWRDFMQPHRHETWRYDGLKFVFEREQYEEALTAIDS